MKKILKSSTLIVVLFIFTYLLFVFPFDIFKIWTEEKNINWLYSFISTIITFIIVRTYFATKITFTPLRIFVCEGIGIGFIAFNLVCLILILDVFIKWDEHIKSNLFLISLITLVSIGYISTSFVRIKTIKIQSEKIIKKKHLVFISDTHLGSNSIRHLKKIIKKINTINPDLILIGGDLIDTSSFKLDELSVLRELKIPIYFVTGNHEYYLKNSKEKINSLKEFNINILDNQSILLGDVNLIGISDNQNINNQKDVFFSKKVKNLYNLCLVHKPSLWKSIKGQTDLMLSGHTHNGQIFPFNFLVKLQFKENYGLYKYKNSSLYVSSGSGTWGPKIRLGSFNEVISIVLNPV